MTKNNSKLWKFVKLGIIAAAVACVAYMVLMIGSVLLMIMAASDHTELYGDIIVSERTYYKGDPLPLEFQPPEELQDIHGLMWDLHYVDESLDAKLMDNLFEGETILETYTQEEVNEIFGKEITDISRVAIYYPTEPGVLKVELYGFYKQTNPQYIAETEVIIHEK
ncbi:MULTISPECIES: hypothetical protein [unclassified Fusibacter]|uniref:hypothetical protein n=1 Tax=unclassified Fusibacter TaxID=2624464 RepID=UPI001012866E|nr:MULTISPECIES: hypothetical protein [unclassified Fusibacter]MCK8060238.1 hypothetical protein [Fusibacter sp. A2]NPE22377.1 hypothetical protein [Fusibacter sp. A1]RXV61149.1 hypothetical protein DWB64_11065 [Fusibacter sp. A1]